MAITFLSTFLLAVAKAGIWIFSGMIIYKHYDFILLLITNKLININDVSTEKKDDIHKYIKWIGLCVIFVGVTTILTQLFTIGFMF